MDFFDGGQSEYVPQFKQNDKVIFSGTVSRDNFKKQKKRGRVGGLIIFVITVLATVVCCVLGFSGFSAQKGVIFCAVAVIVVLYFISVVAMLKPTGKKEYERIGSPSVVFDFSNGTIAIVRGSGSLVLPADAISDVEEDEEVILVYYDTRAARSEQKAALSEAGHSFRLSEMKRGVIACQKNLLTVGEIGRALSFTTAKAEEFKAKTKKCDKR